MNDHSNYNKGSTEFRFEDWNIHGEYLNDFTHSDMFNYLEEAKMKFHNNSENYEFSKVADKIENLEEFLCVHGEKLVNEWEGSLTLPQVSYILKSY